jgi:hypothetical protein
LKVGVSSREVISGALWDIPADAEVEGLDGVAVCCDQLPVHKHSTKRVRNSWLTADAARRGMAGM